MGVKIHITSAIVEKGAEFGENVTIKAFVLLAAKQK